MAGNKPEQEPSIEEILASIRRIISKSTKRLSAATKQMTTLSPMPRRLGSFQNATSTPNSVVPTIDSVSRFISPEMSSVAPSLAVSRLDW